MKSTVVGDDLKAGGKTGLTSRVREVSELREISDSTGTQAIERSIFLLTTITGRPHLGWRLTDLAASCGLSKSTTHRILSTLVSHRLLKQRPEDRRYFPGPLLYDLALALPAHFAFQAACRPDLSELAARMRTSIFLTLRSDDCYVCIEKAGKIPLGLMSRMGTRRPLPTAGMGIAILIDLPAVQRDEIITSFVSRAEAANDPQLSAYLKIYRRSRRCGFGLNLADLGNGLASVGVAIRNPEGMPFASLTAIGEASSYSHARIWKLAEALQAESGKIAFTHEHVIAAMS